MNDEELKRTTVELRTSYQNYAFLAWFRGMGFRFVDRFRFVTAKSDVDEPGHYRKAAVHRSETGRCSDG